MSFEESENGSFFIDRDMQTRRSEADEIILADVREVLRGLGLAVVEVSSARRRGVLHVVLVIHRSGGVDLNACTQAYRAIYPRLEMLHPESEIRLEVSSPGVERRLKSPEEFEIFTGLGVELLLDEESDWKKGIIIRSSKDSVDIKTGDMTETFLFSSIRRAKLDNS